MLLLGKSAGYRYYIYRRIGQSRRQALTNLWRNAPIPDIRISVWSENGGILDSVEFVENARPEVRSVKSRQA